jgi:NADPH-dependent ferric siderophore reductase
MGKVPSFLGSVVDSAFGTELTARQIMDFSSQIRRVVFQSPKLFGERSKPMGKVEIHVGQGHFRSYTPLGLDSGKGEITLLIHLHGNGVGSSWAENLKVGSKVKVFGPEGSVKTNLQASTHLCFGDETALGAFVSLQSSLPSTAKIYGAVELADAAILNELGLPLASVSKTNETSLISWLKNQKPLPPDSQVYLLGRAKSIGQLRSYFVQQLNFPKTNIHTKAYWADGKSGL